MSEYKSFKMKGNPMQRNFPDSFKSSTGSNDTPLEKFDWGAAFKGGAGGAAKGSMFGPWGTAIGAIGGGLMAGFKGPSKQEEEQARMMTAQLTEQEAKSKLAEYAVKDKERSGGYGGYNDAETT